MQRETKAVTAAEIRIAEGDEGRFSGYAAVFGEPDSFGDTIKPGAFRKTIGKRNGGSVAMLWNHNPDRPIGVWTDLAEDRRGLKVSGQLVLDTAQGREAHALLKAGAVNGLSIGFRARAAERGPNGGRVLTEIQLAEISIVSLPAASKARVTSVRNTDGTAGIEAFTRAARRAASIFRETT